MRVGPHGNRRLFCALLLACTATGVARAGQALEPLDLVLGTSGPPRPVPSGAPLADAEALRGFVRDRLRQPAFYEAVLPRLFKIFSRRAKSMFYASLKHVAVPGGELYFIDRPGRGPGAPCPEARRERVVPWWDRDASLLVCAEDHLPAVQRVELKPGVMAYCEGLVALDPRCGCGPQLAHCAPAELVKPLQDAANAEPLLTARAIIQQDEPFDTVLTTNATVRPPLLDFYYERAVHERLEPMAARGALGPVARRPRPPAFAGGVLSTPTGMTWEARRLAGGLPWDDFLCMPLVAARTSAEPLFHIGGSDLRMRAHDGLATMTGCKDCHARLEGAVGALAAFSTVAIGRRFVVDPAQRSTVAFFGRNASDRRAEGPAEIDWLMRTLVAQPEFDRCITDKVVAMFFGGEAADAAATSTIQRRFSRGRRFAQLVEDVAVLRFLGPRALPSATEEGGR